MQPSENNLSLAFEKFHLVLGGHILFQVLQAAAELDLFTLLEQKGPLTRPRIAELLLLKPQPCRILLLGLVATGILEKNGEEYSNSVVAKRFLVAGTPTDMTPILRWQQHINYPAMQYFSEALRENRNVGLKIFPGSGNTLYERLGQDPRLEKIFQDAMHSVSMMTPEALSQSLDLSRTEFLVDVGGGDGTNLIQLAKANPNFRGAVFDSTTVCRLASTNIQRHGCEDRLTALAGNCLQDPLPTGADCFLFCHFFTIWSLERGLTILQKTYAALPKGGRAIIYNMMQHDDETGPLTAAIGSPYFLTLATGEGMLYTWKEYEQIFQKAGFPQVERISLPRDHGIIIGTK